jgi:hypothetical protein
MQNRKKTVHKNTIAKNAEEVKKSSFETRQSKLSECIFFSPTPAVKNPREIHSPQHDHAYIEAHPFRGICTTDLLYPLF